MSKYKLALKTGGLLLNFSMFSYLKNENEKIGDWYNKLPEQERERIYNDSPLNRYGHDLSAMSAIQERMLRLDQKENKKAPLNKPYAPGNRKR